MLKHLPLLLIVLLILPLATALEIKTDKLNYIEGDKINLEIFPKNTEVILTYAGQTIRAANNAEFEAVLYQNQIIVELQEEKTTKIINVKSQANKKLIKDFLSLSFLGIIMYVAAKKYYIKFNGI